MPSVSINLNVAALFKGSAKKSPTTTTTFAATAAANSNNNNNTAQTSIAIASDADCRIPATSECPDELLNFGQPTPLKLFSYKECPVPLPSQAPTPIAISASAHSAKQQQLQRGRPSAPHPIRRVYSLDSAPVPLSKSLPSSFSSSRSASAMAVATRRASAPNTTVAPELVRQQQEKVSLEITMAGKTDALTAQLFRSYRKTRDLAHHAPQVRHH